MLFKFLIILAAALSAASVSKPPASGWQAQKGAVDCTWTKQPDGSAACVCRFR